MAQFNILTEEEQKAKLLQELYELNDEYNKFVINMDKKLDIVLSKVESLYEGTNIC